MIGLAQPIVDLGCIRKDCESGKEPVSNFAQWFLLWDFSLHDELKQTLYSLPWLLVSVLS